MSLAFSDRGSLVMVQGLATPGTAVTTTGGIAAVRYRTGPQPAQAATITSAGTLLTTFDIAEADMAAVGHQVTIAAPEATTAVADGTIGHVEVVDSLGEVLFVGSVGTPGSGADIIVDNPTLVTGQTVNLDTFTFSIPQVG